MKKLTREWVKKAETDYHVATQMIRTVPAEPDAVCFHSQQMAEKFLKGLLQELGAIPPRTHDLLRLYGLLQPHFPSLRSLRRGLLFLTRHAVDTRYPGEHPTKREALAALRWADRVRTVARALLRIRPKKPRPKKWP
jgi:HEPN domain-containing protein